jgi:hypothetical protein
MSVLLAVSTAACAGAKSRAGSRAVVLTVRHVAAAAAEARKVDAGTAAGEGKSAPVVSLWASPCARSAQIKGAVSVYQESLIH